MSLLPATSHANPSTPFWAKAGTGGGSVTSVSAGFGTLVTGTATDPVINNAGVISQVYATNNPVGGIKMTNGLLSILGGTVVPLPVGQKTRLLITYSIRFQNTGAPSDDYYVDPVVGGISIRTGNATAYDYTTTGNGHWDTISGVVSTTVPAGTLGATTFDLFMKSINGVGQMYVYSTNVTIQVCYSP
jgi:hypothetical protein